MYQLPGDMSTLPNVRRSSVMPRLATLILIWIAMAAGYGLYRLYGRHQPAAASTTSPSLHQTSAVHAQDYTRHVAEASATIRRAQARIQGSERLFRQLLLQSDSSTQTKALIGGLGNLEAARQDLEQSREELDFVQSNLKGESQ